MNKDISVIIPTYNRAESLSSCLCHLANQTMSKDRYEVIVVDDGGNDHTDEVVKEYQNKNALIVKYVRQLNKGPAAARNKGARLSSAEILFFMDDDCLAKEDALMNVYNEFKTLNEQEVCLGGIKMPGRQNFVGHAIDLTYGYGKDTYKFIHNIPFLSASHFAVKRDFFITEGGFDERLRCGEDSEWCYRLRLKGYKLVRHPSIVVFHQHKRKTLKDLIQQTFFWGLNSDIKIFVKYKNFLKNEVSLQERILLELYHFFLRNSNIIFILLFAILIPFIAFVETLSFCFYMFRLRKETVFLSPLLFLRFLSREYGYLTYFLKQLKIKNHKKREGLKNTLFYALNKRVLRTPPYLVFFVTNNCNASCGHCFYWRRIKEAKSEMTLEEYSGLSAQLGFIEKLSLTGGEPFLRDDLASIAEIFYRNNHVKKIGITSNGLCADKIVATTKQILDICPEAQLGICLGLDGLGKIHDRIRGVDNAFESVIDTYDQLIALKKNHGQLQLDLNFTLTDKNEDEFLSLYEFVKNNMPECWPLTFSILRTPSVSGSIIEEPRDISTKLPHLNKVKFLARKILKDIRNQKLWIETILKEACFGHILEIMRVHKQIITCLMGSLYAVVDELSNVYFCEYRRSIGNLKEKNFKEIWSSREAKQQREEIRSKQCFCYHSFFQDLNLRYQLLNAFVFIKAVRNFRAWANKYK